MIISGINNEIDESIPISNVSGVSIEILSDQFVPNNIGLSFDDFIDLVVYAVDENDNILSGVTFTVTNSTSNDTTITGNFIGLSVGQSDNLDVTASSFGFISASISISFTEGESQRLFIVLQEVPRILFNCTTEFKNSQGITIDKPITSGFVQVTFSANANFNIDDYSVLFEAIRVGGSKFNSVILGYELTSNIGSVAIFKINVVQEQGDYCYLSNIIKKIC